MYIYIYTYIYIHTYIYTKYIYIHVHIIYIYTYSLLFCLCYLDPSLSTSHPKLSGWGSWVPGLVLHPRRRTPGRSQHLQFASRTLRPARRQEIHGVSAGKTWSEMVRYGQIWSDYVRLKLDIWSTWRFWSLSWLADLRMNNIWTSAFRIAPEAHRKTQQLSSPGSWSCIVLPKWGEATPLYHVPRMCRTLSGPPEASSAENLGQLRILSRFNGYRLSSIFSWPWWRGRKKGGLTFTFRFANSIITAPENHSAGKRHHHHDRQRSSWKLKNHSC